MKLGDLGRWRTLTGDGVEPLEMAFAAGKCRVDLRLILRSGESVAITLDDGEAVWPVSSYVEEGEMIDLSWSHHLPTTLVVSGECLLAVRRYDDPPVVPPSELPSLTTYDPDQARVTEADRIAQLMRVNEERFEARIAALQRDVKLATMRRESRGDEAPKEGGGEPPKAPQAGSEAADEPQPGQKA